ncbi:DUF2254 family protein [Streptomyces sp. NPDC053431]|uniref:DUF2254 family protein n=1 Tax=Streptomyces sp. NPDC053431 TaxID=3365703 RepID=UPI0037CDD6C4
MDAPPTMTLGPARSTGRVVRPRRALRAGAAQIVAGAVGFALGVLLPRLGDGYQVAAVRAVDVLKVVGVGVLSVGTLIFSLLFLVVQWAAGNFSHRLLLFRSDPLVWRVFALVVGILVFSVTATLATGSRRTVSVAVPAAALVLTGAALVLVRRLLLTALRSIQLAHVLTDLRRRGRNVLLAVYPSTDAVDGRAPDTGENRRLPDVTSTVVWPDDTVLVAQVDLLRLVRAAARADAVVVLKVPVGRPLYRGDVLAEVRGGRAPVPAGEVLGAVVGEPERTFHQDPTLAFRLLSDIGLRALSPAVHDPATAVQVLDALEDLLRLVAPADLGDVSVTDRDGAVRVVMRLPAWEEFVRVGLDDLCRAATDAPMVLSRAGELLRRVGEAAEPRRRPGLDQRLAWVERELADRHPAFLRGPVDS